MKDIYLINKDTIYIELTRNFIYSRSSCSCTISRVSFIKKELGEMVLTVGRDYFRFVETVFKLKTGILVSVSDDRIAEYIKTSPRTCKDIVLSKNNNNQGFKLLDYDNPVINEYKRHLSSGYRIIRGINKITISISGEEIKLPKKDLTFLLYYNSFGFDLSSKTSDDDLFEKRNITVINREDDDKPRIYFVVFAKVIEEYKFKEDIPIIPIDHYKETTFYKTDNELVYGIYVYKHIGSWYYNLIKGIRYPKAVIESDGKMYICKIRIKTYNIDFSISIEDEE